MDELSDEFYTVDEVAKLLKVTRVTVYDWMRSGALPYVYVGERRRITRSALQSFIREGRPEAPQKDSEEIDSPALVYA